MGAEPSVTPSGAFERLLKERYSCRAFLPRQVDTATITKILEIAQRTPSWCNSQPWQVVITRGAATERFRGALCEYVAAHEREPDFACPREYRGVYLERRRECGFQLYASVGIARGDREAEREGAEGGGHGSSIVDRARGGNGTPRAASRNRIPVPAGSDLPSPAVCAFAGASFSRPSP